MLSRIVVIICVSGFATMAGWSPVDPVETLRQGSIERLWMMISCQIVPEDWMPDIMPLPFHQYKLQNATFNYVLFVSPSSAHQKLGLFKRPDTYRIYSITAGSLTTPRRKEHLL